MENYNYILTSDGELYHYGVIGMKWGKRKARIDSAAENAHTAKGIVAKSKARREYKEAKKAYKKETSLNKQQRLCRFGATVAATLLLSPIGGVATAALMTSHYRGKNDIERE